VAAEPKKRGTWGGRRPGAGAKPLTPEKRLERRLREAGIDPADAGDPVAAMAERIGLSPRGAALRPDLADRFEVVPPGEHLDRFARTFCRYTQLGEVAPDGPRLGDPYALEAFERDFFDEALSCDATGRRLHRRAGLVIARKNRKTTSAAVLALYMASPADAEHRPYVVQGAGTLDQAGKLYETTRAFVDDPLYGSDDLRRLFLPM
jgi:hypothetical protein